MDHVVEDIRQLCAEVDAAKSEDEREWIVRKLRLALKRYQGMKQADGDARKYGDSDSRKLLKIDSEVCRVCVGLPLGLTSLFLFFAPAF